MDTRQQFPRMWGGFTLVELLAVVVIIGIFVGFAAPGLFSSHLSKTLSSTTSSLTGFFDEARWKAIQKRTYVRVIFPSAPVPLLEARLDREITLNSYNIAVWDRQTSSWSLDGPWRSLPKGLGFEDGDDPADLPVANPKGKGVISGSARTLEDIDLDRDSEPDPFLSGVITFQADGSCAATTPSEAVVVSWMLTVAEGDIGPDGTFDMRRPKSFRSLVVDCATGTVTEIVPVP